MVRIMAGALCEAGSGRKDAEELRRAMESGDRKALGKTMPPRGLTLIGVEYEEISGQKK